MNSGIEGNVARLRHWHAEGGQVFAEHEHREAQFEILLFGQYVKQIESRQTLRQHSTGYFLAPRVAHSCRYDTDVASLTVSFSRDEDLKRLSRPKVAMMDSHQLGLNIAYSTQCLFRELHAPDDLSPLALDAWASDLLISILRSDNWRVHAKRPSWLTAVIERLHDATSKPVTINELAALTSFHPHHLSREFRLRMGVPIATYQRRLRLQGAARSLLLGTPIPEAAAVAGYATPSQFSTAFKKAFCLSPSEYRRQHAV